MVSSMPILYRGGDGGTRRRGGSSRVGGGEEILFAGEELKGREDRRFGKKEKNQLVTRNRSRLHK